MGIIRDIQDDLNLAAVRLVGEHRGRLLSEAKRLCGDESEAEDLVMITFDQAFRDYDSFDPKKGDFQAWLFGILHRVYGKSNRRLVNRRTQPVDEGTLSGLEEADNKTVEEILRRSDSEAVRHAIDQLDEKYKSVLMMRFYEGFSYREIAGILGKPIGTVGRRIQVALQILAGKLKSEFGAAKPKLAAIAAVFLSLASFAAVTVGIVEVVRSSLGSLGSEGPLEAAADTLDPKVPNPDPIVPKDPNSPASTGAGTLSTNTENNKEETMNLKSITQTAAKLSVGAVLTTGLAANTMAEEVNVWTYDGTYLTDGNWTLTVTCSKKNLTVSGFVTADDLSELNLRGEVKGIDGTAYAIVSVKGLNVDAVQDGLVQFTCADTQTSVGSSAFNSCTNLTTVKLSDVLTKLDTSAFEGCTSLRTVTPLLPGTVSSIGNKAFYNCPIEGVLSVGEGVASVSFGKSGGQSTGNTFVGTHITDYIAGTGVTSVVGAMFDGVTTLTNVVFKGAITEVGYNAFSGCSNLRTVEPLLPPSVGTLKYGAFNGCPIEGALYLGMTNDVTFSTQGGGKASYAFKESKLSEVHLGPALTSFPNDVFNAADSTTDVYLHGAPTLAAKAFNGFSPDSRFFLDRDERSWDDWLADEANATAWTNLTPEAQAAYYEKWGAGAKHPKARTVGSLSPFPKNTWLLRFHLRTPGMKLIFK